MTVEEIEQKIRCEAEKLVHDEPLSVLMITEQILNSKNFAAMLSVTLSCQLAGEVIDRAELEKVFGILYLKYPELITCAALPGIRRRDFSPRRGPLPSFQTILFH